MMNALSSGTEDIVLETGQTIGAVLTKTVTAAIYQNQTASYNHKINIILND